MSYPITVNLIPGLPQQGYRNGVGAYEGVVNHSTATPEATDTAERNYEANHWNDAFVHFFVDWDSITQVADTRFRAWGAGANANPRFVHIELCETADAGKFQESYRRYVWLTAYLLAGRKLGVSDAGTLWSHAEVTKLLGGTTHSDPIAYLASHGVSWGQHIANVATEYNNQTSPAPTVAPASVGSSYTVQNGDTLWGISRKVGVTVDQLKSLNGLTDNTIHPGQVLKVANAPATFLLQILAPSLWYYSAPDWNAKKALVHAGEVFTVVETLTVSGSKMYKLKSGTYITANPSFVKVL